MTTRTTTKAKAATFDLTVLTELTVNRKVSDDNRISFACLRAVQGDYAMYTFVARAADIFPLITVPRCDGETGYQRDLSEKRARAIAAYLANGNPIPGNIILHIRPEGGFKYKAGSKTLSFNNVNGVLAALDGQHRAWGASLEGNAQFFFTCFVDLTTEQEAGIFLDVNNYQKGVSAALTSRVKGIAGRENATERQISALFDRLISDEQSALFGKLSALEARGGLISHRGFMTSMKPVVRLAGVRVLAEEKRYTLLNRIYQAGAEILGDDFYRVAVFGGYLANVERIIAIAMQRGSNLQFESIQRAVAALKDFSKETAMGASTRLNKTHVTNHIAELLGDVQEFDEDAI